MNTGLPVFDTTVQETNEWLKLVQARLRPCDRQQAYSALRAVLQALRDRLPMEAVLGLSAQLPMLIRGIYLEDWRPGGAGGHDRSLDAFHDLVAKRLPPVFPRRPNEAVEAVFSVLADHVDPAEVDKLMNHLPARLRPVWADWAV